MKSQVSTPKSMHIQKSFQCPGHSRFLCARAFEESKPHTTCSEEIARKVPQIGTETLPWTYFSTGVKNDREQLLILKTRLF